MWKRIVPAHPGGGSMIRPMGPRRLRHRLPGLVAACRAPKVALFLLLVVGGSGSNPLILRRRSSWRRE